MVIKHRIFRWGEKFLKTRFAILLLPISWIWASILFFRHVLYDLHILRARKFPIPIVSIGNLAFGGTGKTPLVIFLAKQFLARRVAILSRGYGGDEMKVIQRHLPQMRLYASADRVAAARKAISDGAELILLDDGFQHRRLARDFDCLVLRAQEKRLFPAGNLRDLYSRRKKADALFSYDKIPGAIRLETKVSRLSTFEGLSIHSLHGIPVAIFCGIGNPERFEKTVFGLGAKIQGKIFFADHEPADLSRLEILLHQTKAKYLVCTEKDAVKLPPTKLPIIIVEIETIVREGQAEWGKLIEKIKASMDN